MTATAQPQGLVPTRHPSGTIRIENRTDGVLSGYTSNIFTGTPVMNGTDGTLQVTAGVAGACIGVFQGCEYTSGTKRFLLPYFPANTVYEAGSMIAKYTADPDIIYEGQSLGPVLAVDVGGAINISALSGNTMTGFSLQTLGAPTGATAGTFTIVGIAPYDDNAWGDAFTKVLVQIAGKQAQVALADGLLSDDQQAAREESRKQEEVLQGRFEEDQKLFGGRREEDKRREDERREEDKRREDERRAKDDEEKNRPADASQLPADPAPGTWAAQYPEGHQADPNLPR